MNLEMNGKKLIGKRSILSLLAFLVMVSVSFANAEIVEVSIRKMRFVPENITINSGDTVRWVNREKRQYHSVWFEALGEPEADYFFPEETVERVFEKAGEYPYRCGPHPEMLGSVMVQKTQEKHSQKVSNERKTELIYLVKQDCGSCHGMLLKGGLGPALLQENLEKNSVEDLSAVILNGRSGTPMPPWRGLLSAQEATWISEQLKAGGFVNGK